MAGKIASLVLLSIALFAGYARSANDDGKLSFRDVSASSFSPITITQEAMVDYSCISNPGNPPTGKIRIYCDSGTGQLTCLSSTGGNVCPAGGGSPSGAVNTLQKNNSGVLGASKLTDTGTVTTVGDDLQPNGPNPYVDLRQYGLVSGTASTTATITGGTSAATLVSGSGFANGNGFVLYGAGPANTMGTQGAPTVTVSQASNFTSTGSGQTVTAPSGGSTSFSYQLVADDCAGGLTAASTAGTTTTGFPLGQQTATISSYTRSGTTVTATTSAAHGLAAGALIFVNTTVGETTLNGWFQVATTPTSTTFTFNSGQSTAGGSPASGTVTATVYYFNVNHLTWSAPNGTAACRYWVYGRTAGSVAALGVSEISSANGVTSLTFNDYGSPYNDNSSFPSYVPSSAPNTATNDWLAGTITSGGGTASVTLSVAATNSVANGTFQLDNAVPFQNAANANCNGAPLYVPSGANYVFNSTMTLPCAAAIQQAGQITLNEPWLLGNKVTWWKGDINPQAWSPGVSQLHQSPVVNVALANPGVYAVPTALINIDHIHFNGTAANNNRLLIIDANSVNTPIPVGEITHSYFSTTGASDYMSQGLIIRYQSVILGIAADLRLDQDGFTSGPTQVNGVPPTPMAQIAASVLHVNRPFFTRRTMAFTILNQVEIDGMGYDSGAIMPMYWLAPTVGSQVPVSISNLMLDTTFFAVGNFASPGNSGFGGPLVLKNISVAGSANLTGLPFSNVTVLGSGGALGQNINVCTVTGSIQCTGPTGVQSAGPGDVGYGFPAPAAPTVTVGASSSCASNCVSSGTYYYAIEAVDATGRNSVLGAPTAAVTVDGTQTVTLSWTPQAGQVFTIPARGTALNNILLCGIPGPNGGTSGFDYFSGTSVVDTTVGFLRACTVSNIYPSPGNSAGLDSTGVAAQQLTLMSGGFTNKVTSPSLTANQTTTFPVNSTGVVAESNLSQTWTANQTIDNSHQLRFLSSNGTNYAGFQGGASASNLIWIFPTTDSSGTQCLSSNGSLQLSFTACSAGTGTPGGSNTQLQFNNSGSFGGNLNLTWSSPALTVGSATNATGQLKYAGTTSGTVTTQSQDAAGTWTFKWPTTGGTNGYPLTTDGTGVSTWSLLGVPGGGTGAATLTANALLAGNGTSAVSGLTGTLTGANPVIKITAGSASAVPLTLNTATSPTGDLQDYQVNGTKTAWFDSGANLNVPSTTYTGTGPLVVSGSNGACPSPVFGTGIICLEDSSSNSVLMSLNGNSFKPLVQWTNTAPTAHGLVVASPTGASFPQQTSIAACATGIPVVGQGSTSDPICSSLGVGGGGTGATTFTAHGVLLGEGTSAVAATAVGATGVPLIGVSGADPAFGGIVNIANGGTGASTLAGASIATVTGTITNGHCADFSSGTVITDSGAACGGSGATALSAITAATGSNSISNGINPQSWLWQVTGSTVAMKYGESAASTGTSNKIFQATTLAGSTAVPFQADNNGNGYQVSSVGLLQPVGAGSIAVPGTSGQIVLTKGGTTAISTIDYPDVKDVPAANCNGTVSTSVGGAGWSIGSGGTVSCRQGTNNLGGFVVITDTSSTFAQFALDLPEDWDTATNPLIRFQVASTDTTSGHTIIPQISVSCAKGDGTTTDDVTFNAAHSSSTITLNTTNHQYWSNSNVQMNSTDMTGCVAGGKMIVQVGRATDTATNAQFYSATVTIPRLLVVQAN